MPLKILFVEDDPRAGEQVRGEGQLQPEVEVTVAERLPVLREELERCPDLNDFVVDLFMPDPDEGNSTAMGFKAIRLIRDKRPAALISIRTAFAGPENQQRAEELNVFRIFRKGSKEADYSAIIDAHRRAHDLAVLEAPFSAAEQERNATYEWCLTDPLVQERYGGLVVAAWRNEVLGAGRTHELALQDARQNHGDRCPSREQVVFVLVPGLATRADSHDQGIAS